MTSDTKTKKGNNGIYRLRSILIIITLIIGLFVFLDNRINNKVASHPEVTRLGEHGRGMDDKFRTMDKRLERIEKKIDRLLERR